MKTFRELESGDVVYVLILNRETGIIKHRRVTFSISAKDASQEGNINIFFREEAEPVISVTPEYYWGIRKLNSIGSLRVVYFSDKEAIDWFLKEEKEEIYKYIGNIDKEHQIIWNEGEPVKVTQEKSFRKGDLLFDKAFSEIMIFDGSKRAYTVDCLDYNIEGRVIEKCSQKHFLQNLSIIITASRPAKAAKLVKILRDNGYIVDVETGNVRRSNFYV